jgi:hypothetical protein
MASSTRMKWPYPSEGADPWYESFDNMVKAIDASVYGSRETLNLIVTGGGTFTWTASTSTLTWNQPIRIYSAQTGFFEQIAAGSIALSTDGAIGYVLFSPQPLSNVTSLPIYEGTQVPPSEPDKAFVLFRRRDSRVFARTGAVIRDGEPAALFDGNVTDPTLAGDVEGPASATVVTALRSIPLSTTPVGVGETYVYNGTEFVPSTFPSVFSLWALVGNAGTNPLTLGGTNYVGTSDNKGLTIATNATSRVFIAANGNVSIPLASAATFSLGGVGAGAIAFGTAGTSNISIGHAAGGNLTLQAGAYPSNKIVIGHAAGGTELTGTFVGSGAFSVNATSEAFASSIGNRTNGLTVSLKSSTLVDLDSLLNVNLNGGTAVNINTSLTAGAAGNTNIGVSGKTVTLTGSYNLASLTAPAATKYSPLRINSTRDLSASAINLAEASEVTGTLPSSNGGTGLGAPAAGDVGKVLTAKNDGTYELTSIAAGGVTSVQGTANQILVNGATTPQTGAVVLTLPTILAANGGTGFSTAAIAAQAGNVLTAKADGTYEFTAGGGGGGSNSYPIPFEYPGTPLQYTVLMRYIAGEAFTLNALKTRASCVTFPTGTNVILQIKIGGVDVPNGTITFTTSSTVIIGSFGTPAVADYEIVTVVVTQADSNNVFSTPFVTLGGTV